MQKTKKSTVVICSLVVVVFLCLLIVLIVQFTKIKQLENSLSAYNEKISIQSQTLREVNAEIEEKSSSAYVEKWARENLGWVFENEIKVVLSNYVISIFKF